MTGLTLAELQCIKDIVEADIDRSVYLSEDLNIADWKCVETMTHYRDRASGYAKLEAITEGLKE